MRAVIRWIVALMVAFGAPACAAPEAPARFVALVIGNSLYRDAKLAGADNDAADMADLLARSGFQVSNLGRLTDLKKDVMQAEIERFIQSVDRQTFVVVYYSGHGIELSGQNYLVPVDADGTSLLQLVALDDVRRRLEQREARTQMLILDACRTAPAYLRYLKKSLTSDGLARITDLGPGTRIVYAASPGQAALSAPAGARNSVFTGALISSAADGGSFDEVLHRAAEKTETDTGSKQRPWIEGHVVLNVPLAAAGKTISPGPLPAVGKDELSKDLRLILDGAGKYSWLDGENGSLRVAKHTAEKTFLGLDRCTLRFSAYREIDRGEIEGKDFVRSQYQLDLADISLELNEPREGDPWDQVVTLSSPQGFKLIRREEASWSSLGSDRSVTTEQVARMSLGYTAKSAAKTALDKLTRAKQFCTTAR